MNNSTKRVRNKYKDATEKEKMNWKEIQWEEEVRRVTNHTMVP
jgi:hypothetical protein